LALRSVCFVDDDDEESEGLSSLTDLVNILLLGQIPPSIAQVLASAKLIALTKDNGKPRPIAIGEILRRLAAKCALAMIIEKLARRLAPMQRGVGISGGPEQLAQIVGVLLEAHPTFCVTKIDVKNAFNSIMRSLILAETLEHVPEVARLVFSCYGGLPPYLWTSDSTWLESLRGVQQGDPLSSALFALALQPVLNQLRAAFPDVVIIAGHDDLALIGTPADCQNAHALYVELAAKAGLQVEAEKSFVYARAAGVLKQDVVDHTSGLPIRTEYLGFAKPLPYTKGVSIFGTPIGAAEWVQEQCRNLVSVHRVVARALPIIGSAQASQHVIAASLSTRINHLQRTMTPVSCESMSRQHDHDMWTATGHVTGHLTADQTTQALGPITETGSWPAIDSHWAQQVMGETPHVPTYGADASPADWAWRQAQLRRKDGGLSIGNSWLKREAAYVASWATLIEQDVLNDFPLMRIEYDRPATMRTPQIAALSEAWEEMCVYIEEDYSDRCTGLPLPHSDHSGLCCLESMARLSQLTASKNDDDYQPLAEFGRNLQRRLMCKVQDKHVTSLLDDACDAVEMAADDSVKRYRLRRWYRFIAVSGRYAHSAFTALPDPPCRSHPNGASENTINDRAINLLTCFRLGLRPPNLRDRTTRDTCPLHEMEADLEDDLGHHFCHCGRSVQHIMHTALLRGFSRIAAEVKGLIQRTEEHFVAGSGMRMDIILTNYSADLTRKLGDVTVGTAMSDLTYVPHGPRKGVRNGCELAGKAARTEESGKITRYGKVVEKSGSGSVVGVCVEDLGTWGDGAIEFLDYIVDARFGPKRAGPKYSRASNTRSRFKWLAIQHIGVQLARAVAEAHDDNLRLIMRLDPAAMRQAYSEDALHSMAQEAASGPSDSAQRLQRAPSYRSFRPTVGGAYHSDRRTPQLPLSNHEGLFDNASPPAGSTRGTMSAADGFRLGLASEGGFGEGGQFLEVQYAAYGRDSDTEGLGSVS
jgi:hypothetical protein